MDPGISFIPTLTKAFEENRIIVVKHAVGGQPIRKWDKEWPVSNIEEKEGIGSIYDALIQKVSSATKGKEIETVTFVWMQGERDAKEKNSNRYQASLIRVIEQLSKDLERDDMNCVIGRLSDHKVTHPEVAAIRQAQVEVADSSPRNKWVNTDDLNDGLDKKGNVLVNDLHYSVEGYNTLGRRFAEESIALIRGPQ